MTTIKRIHVDPPKKPKCQAMRSATYYNDKPDTDKRCVNNASFEINGENYCRWHAGGKALEILLEGR